MNEYQYARENCISSMSVYLAEHILTYGYQKVIRSSSSHMYYYVVVLKNLAKFTWTHLHRSLFSTCTYSFLWVLRNFLETLLLWKTSCELILNREFYERWWTDTFIIIDRFFKKRDIARESVYLRIYIFIGNVLRCSSQWLCLRIFYQVKELICCKYSI